MPALIIALITILPYVYIYIFSHRFPYISPIFFNPQQSAFVLPTLYGSISSMRNRTMTDSQWFFIIEWKDAWHVSRFNSGRDRARFDRMRDGIRERILPIYFSPRTILDARMAIVPSVCIWISCPCPKHPGNVHGPGRARRRLISSPVRAKTDESRLSRLPERDEPMRSDRYRRK
jgi:hypothetical protein